MSPIKTGLTLVLLGAICLGGTLVLQHCSAPRLAQLRQAAETQRLLAVLPPASYDNQPLAQPLSLGEGPLAEEAELLGYQPPRPAFVARLHGQPTAVLLQVNAVQGYGGPIQLLVAITPDGRLLGVSVLAHQETTALGGRIEPQRSDWLRGFSGRSLRSPDEAGWALKADHGSFDQISGATLTSRAVVAAVHRALRYFDRHRQPLLGEGGAGQ
ncbi:MAG: RnfABCDGE type electron transport complex subunit G [Pseudomonas sp.]|uniref:RnfABCDGE type electron transport complex subunit G n=1 Tax=Pseudomonas sp. TaxID=306 RepID=UPI003392A82D